MQIASYLAVTQLQAIQIAQRIAGRQRCHLDPGNPAFSQAQHALKVGRGKTLSGCVGQVVLGFLKIETQCIGVDFKQLIACLQTAHRQLRNAATAHQQVQATGGMQQ